MISLSCFLIQKNKPSTKALNNTRYYIGSEDLTAVSSEYLHTGILPFYSYLETKPSKLQTA